MDNSSTIIKDKCKWEKGKTVKATVALMETASVDGTTNRNEPLAFKSLPWDGNLGLQKLVASAFQLY